MAMPVAVSVNFPVDKPFCRGRRLRVDEDATLLSMLRVALGDNMSLHTSHVYSRDWTTCMRENLRLAACNTETTLRFHGTTRSFTAKSFSRSSTQ